MRPYRISIATQDWRPVWSDSQWPEVNGPRRLISVHAGHIVPRRIDDDVDLQLLEDEPDRYFHNLSLDRGKSSGRPRELWSRGYDIVTGDVAEAEYQDLERSVLDWPENAAEKLTRLLARAPYDHSTRSFISDHITLWQQRFSERTAPLAFAELIHIERLVSEERDPFGYRPGDVPMSYLDSRIKDFRDRINTVFGEGGDTGLLRLWDVAWVSSMIASGVDRRALTLLDEEVTALYGQRKAVSTEMDEVAIGIQDINNQIEDALFQAQNRQDILRKEWKRKQDELKDLWNATTTIPFVFTAFGAAYPAAAPALMVASQTLTTGAQLVYQHNTGQNIDLVTVAKTTAEVDAEHREYTKLLREMHKQWEKSEENFDNAWSHITGKKKDKTSLDAYLKAVQAYGKTAQTLYEKLKPPGYQATIEIAEFEEDDDEFQLLLQKVERLRSDEAEFHARFAEQSRALESVSADILQRAVLRNELLTLDLQNDRDRERYARLSAVARHLLLANVARRAAELRRTFLYLTGADLGLPDQILFFADDQVARSGQDLKSSDSSEVQKVLELEHDNAKRAYETFLAELRERRKDYEDQFGVRTPQSILFSTTYAGNSGDNGDDHIGMQFLDALNQRLAALVRTSDPDMLARRAPIRIPFERRLRHLWNRLFYWGRS
jgi:hypothetical protein